MTGAAYEIAVAPAARADLASILDYVAVESSPSAADMVLEGILRVIRDLASFPGRGSVPREIDPETAVDYRQVFFHKYRVIYAVAGRSVEVLVIADGRRELADLLRRRVAGRGGVSGS